MPVLFVTDWKRERQNLFYFPTVRFPGSLAEPSEPGELTNNLIKIEPDITHI